MVVPTTYMYHSHSVQLSLSHKLAPSHTVQRISYKIVDVPLVKSFVFKISYYGYHQRLTGNPNYF